MIAGMIGFGSGGSAVPFHGSLYEERRRRDRTVRRELVEREPPPWPDHFSYPRPPL